MTKKGGKNKDSNATTGPEENVQPLPVINADETPTKEGVESVCRDVSGAINKLKNDYPTDGKLVANILGAISQDKKVNEFVKAQIFEVVPNVMRRLFDDNILPNAIINLLTIISNLTAYDNMAFRIQACTDTFLKVLSDIYKQINSNNNNNFGKQHIFLFKKVGCTVLANITVADETVEKVLKTPNLFALGSNEMLVVEHRKPASLFLMNCSYEDIGRDLMTNGKIEIYEALVSYIATLNDHDTLEQCYLAISNSFTVASVEKRNKILKAIASKKFFETSVPRDIKRMFEFAAGLVVNVGQEDLECHLVINKELMEAIAYCVAQPKSSPELIDLIGGILHHFFVNEKKVASKLSEAGAGPLLKQIAQHRDPTIKEYSTLLSKRVDTLKGDLDTVQQKCSNRGCISRSKDMKKCSGCGAAWYCSKDCQIADWKRGHKAACGKLKEQLDQTGKVNKTQADIDRTVAMNFIKENEQLFKSEAQKKKFKLSQCVVMADLTTLPKAKSAVYTIPDYYDNILKRQPFAGQMDMTRLRESHDTSSKGSAFIAIVVQPTTVNAFVVPMEEPDIRVNWKALLRGEEHEDEWLDEVDKKEEKEEEGEEDYDDDVEPAPGLVTRFMNMLGLDW